MENKHKVKQHDPKQTPKEGVMSFKMDASDSREENRVDD